jgi:hypothetical protein
LEGYALGTHRSATAPEKNSSRLTRFRSTCFDSPANNDRMPHQFTVETSVERGRAGIGKFWLTLTQPIKLLNEI